MDKSDPKIRFVVNGSRWYRGKGYPGSRLQRAGDGQRCCLGFLGEAVGVREACLVDRGYPDSDWPDKVLEVTKSYPHVKPEHLEKLRRFDFDWLECMPLGRAIAEVNDTTILDSDDKRKDILKILFESAGIEVEFRP